MFERINKKVKGFFSSQRMKTLALMLLVGTTAAMAQNAAGDYSAGTTALTTVTEEIAKYVPIVVKLCYAIAGVVAIVGAISVYIAMNNEEQDVKKKIMIGADLIIAAAGAVLAIVALYMELPIWMVMVVLFIRSIGTAFHTPALNAVTPLLVPEEQLTKCAGYSQSLQSISYIVSPAVAALLYSVWELNAIIAIDVLGAVIASITVAIVRIPKLGDQVQSLKPNFIREMKEGMAVLRQNKGLFALLLVGTLYMFVYMPINALYPLITMECFNGTPMHISITEIAYASGMLIGGLLLGLFGNYQKRILLITASIFMMGISLTISGLLPQSGFFIFVVCCAIMGLSVPFYSGVQTALFQEKIKPEYLGRVFSLTGSIMSLAMPIGLILSGFFADRIGVNHWFLLSGVLIIGIAIACPMITEVRKLDLKQNS